MIRLRLGDGPHQSLQIETTVDEVLFQGRQKFRVGRRIGVPNVVFGLDQSSFEEVFPVAVDQRLGEKRILFRTHPADQPQPWIFIRRDLSDVITECRRFEQLARLDVLPSGKPPLMKDQILAGGSCRLSSDLREESRQAVIVVPGSSARTDDGDIGHIASARPKIIERYPPVALSDP